MLYLSIFSSIFCFIMAAAFLVALCRTFLKNGKQKDDRVPFSIFFIFFSLMGLFGTWQYTNNRTYEQYSAMSSAIVHGDDAAVQMMIGKHLDVNREYNEYSHDTLVDFAIRSNRIDYLKWFAKSGAKGLEWTADVPDGQAGLDSEAFKAAKAQSQARIDALEKQDRLDNLKKLF